MCDMQTTTTTRPRSTLTVQVYPELRERIRERAEREDRSLGQVIRHAVQAYLADDETDTTA